jgi:hypothetical protein
MRDMETGKPKGQFARNLLISFSIALGIFLLIHTRIVKAPNGRMLVWGWEAHAWAVFPKTIRMAEGEIFVKPFTKVAYDRNYLSWVELDIKHLKYSLTVMDNTIDEGVMAVTFDSFGFRTEQETPVSFKFDNYIFKVSNYEHQAYYEDSNDNGERDADEELFYERMLFITDFDEIVLADDTVIKNASLEESFILKINKNDSKLYFTSSRSYFIVYNPAWEKEKYLGSITFEPNWGKMITYREVENPVVSTY